MALPAPFLAALSQPGIALDLWVEIEGCPWAYGLTRRESSWFSSRPVAQRRMGVADVLLDVPRGAEQEARPLDAESSIGQMTVQLQVDDAGTVFPLIANGARRDGTIRLASDLSWSAAPTTLAYDGVADGWGTSGTFFLGRETFSFTSRLQGATSGSLGGVTRGIHALPGIESRYEHTAGDLLSIYPRFLATRRVFIFATLDGTDANRVARWAGTVRGAKFGNGGTVLELTAESLDGDLSSTVFGRQRTAKLGVGLAEADGRYAKQSASEADYEASRMVLAADSRSGDWSDGSEVLVRIGDEYVAGTVKVTDAEVAITISGRGCLSSTAVQHAPGEGLKEVIWTGRRSATGSEADQISQFSMGDHPIDLVLQFILSKRGDGANGAYDVLPAEWGLGIDASRVDIAGAKAIKRTWFSGARHLWVYEEPGSLKEIIAGILRPHGCYPVTALNDLLTIRRLSPPIPGATLRAIDADAIVAVPSWDANIANVVGRVTWSCDFDAISGDNRQTFKGEMQGPGTEAQEFYAGLWQTIEVEARGQFTGNDAASAIVGANISTGAAEAFQRYFEMVRDRYARPFPLIGVECSYAFLNVEVGDLVSLTAENLPDVTEGAMGIAGAICEVLKKVIDDIRGVVSFTLLHSTTTSQFRLMAPSGTVQGISGNQIQLISGAFGDLAGVYADDDQAASDGFFVGQVVEVWDPKLATSRGTATVTATGGAYLTLSSVPSGTSAFDVITLAAYSLQPAAERLRHAFMAATDSMLGGDAGHQFAT